MSEFTQYNFFSQTLLLLSLAFTLIALVALFNSFWRAHKMLAIFLIYSIIGVIIFALRKVMGVFGFNHSAWWLALSQYFDLGVTFFLMLSAIEFYKIIRRLDGENPPKKK